MSDDAPPKVTVKWSRRHVHISATRGAVSTEATLTVDEATQLHTGLGKLLYGPGCRFEYCTAPRGECDTPE